MTVRSSERPSSTVRYTVAVSAAAVLGLVAAALFAGFPERLSWFGALLALSVLSSLGRPAAIGPIRVSASGIVQLAAIPLVGIFGAALVASVGMYRTKPIKDVFNAAQRILLVLAGAAAYQRVGGEQLAYGSGQTDVGALAWQLAVATLVATVVNAALLAGVLVLSSAGSFRVFFIDLLQQAVPTYALLAVAAYMLTILWAPVGMGWVSALFFLPSLFVVQWALRQHAALWSTRHEALAPFVTALDAGHPGSLAQCRLVSGAARAIATGMGLKPGVVDQVTIAAQLRDLGLLAIEGDREKGDRGPRRDHAEAARDVLGDVSFLAKPLDLVAAHHERIDGGGGPRGLAGESIPLGARILAVADTWGRRTHEVGDPEAAVLRCETLAGTALDVRCVAALRRALERGQLPALEAAR